MRKFLKKAFCFVLVMVLSLSSVVPSFADNPCSRYSANSAEYKQCWNNFAGQNNILFYDPAGGGTDCAPSTINGNSVTIIGDSISYGARSEYASQIPGADYEEKTFNGVTYQLTQASKHFSADVDGNYSGMTIARVLQEQGALRPYVVFALGTNDPGVVTEGKIKELMDLIGTNHRVVLVTNYAIDGHLDYSVNNAAIRAAKNKYDNVAVADWAAEMESKSNPAEYIPDTKYWVHPNEKGNKLFVELIKKALNSLAGGVGGVSSNNNRNYSGKIIWSEQDLNSIASRQSIYKEGVQAAYRAKEFDGYTFSENKQEFPWEIMAVLHFHETGGVMKNPLDSSKFAYGQGLYGLYYYTRKENSDGSRSSELDLNKAFLIEGELSDEEFLRQTTIAAEQVRKSIDVYIRDGDNEIDYSNPDVIKRIFAHYNGQASEYEEKARALGFGDKWWEGSPYVMNRYDAQRDPDSSEVNPAWAGRYTSDGVYVADSVAAGFGTFVQYEALGGGGFCSSGYGKIADTAINLAWSVEEWAARGGYDGSKRCLYGGTQYPQCIPKDTYDAAMNQINNHRAGTGWSDSLEKYITVSIGASCDQFVSTVMKYSGADSEFQLWGAENQLNYLSKHSEKYSEINVTNVDDLQPGDIFVNDGHIVLYVGLVDGKETVAEASFGQYTGRLSNTSHYISGLRNNGKIDGYQVFRRINWNGS